MSMKSRTTAFFGGRKQRRWGSKLLFCHRAVHHRLPEDVQGRFADKSQDNQALKVELNDAQVPV